MRTLFLFLISLLALIPQAVKPRVFQVQTKQPAIISPQPGQVLQGSIPVVVDTSVEGFQSAEIYFGYSNDPTQTWFLIQTSETPLANAVLAQWDTTTITDGNYSLRLVVYRQNDKALETLLTGLRVRNYSPVETDTPAPATSTPSPEPGQEVKPTPTLTPVAPTATLLPTNPAELTSANIMDSMGRGALVVFGFFVLLGAYIWIRTARRNKS